MSDWLEECLAKYKRIAITGGPRTGKTTLAGRIADRPIVHTDDYKHLDWSECSRYVCALVNEMKGPLVVEGVRVPHALRKGMLVDAVIWLDQPLMALTRGQRAMRDACNTVMMEVRQDMKADWVFIASGVLKRAIAHA